MKKLLAILLSTLCAACTPSITKVNVPDIAKSDSLSVRDSRPVSEKEFKIFSLLITSKKYGIMREGDVRLSPSPMRLLQQEVFEKFAASGHFPRVNVLHFVVYSNMKSQFRSAAAFGAVGGLAGAVVANAVASHVVMANTGTVDEKIFDSLSGDAEYQRGLFTLTDNPTKASIFTVYIDTDIDGEKQFTRTVSSIRQKGDENPLVTAVLLAITNHLAHYDTNGSTVPVMPAAPVIDARLVAAPAAALGSSPEPNSAVNPASKSIAQGVANQLGCGVVKANGDSTYYAACGDHGVVIECDGSRCYPTRSIRMP